MIKWRRVVRHTSSQALLFPPAASAWSDWRVGRGGVYLQEAPPHNIVIWAGEDKQPVLAGPFDTLDQAKVAYLMLRAAG